MTTAQDVSPELVARLPAARGYRIEPSRRRFSLNVRELWEHRELLLFLVWRDLKVRYQQTLLGISWAIIQPVVQMVIFTILFGRLAGIEPEYKVPYPLFVFAGLLPWLYFSSSLAKTSLSVVSNAGLISKVYFPRLILPLTAVVVPVVDFLIAFAVLVVMFVWYGRLPHWHAVVTPFFLGMALFTALGVGLWLSALNVRYRDIPYIVPFLTQVWFFLSPVIYGITFLEPEWHWWLALNPMTGVLDGFRWAVLGRGIPHYDIFAISWAVAIGLAVSGLWYFRRTERAFADVI